MIVILVHAPNSTTWIFAIVTRMRKQCVPGALSSPSSAPGNEEWKQANLEVLVFPFSREHDAISKWPKQNAMFPHFN